MKISLHFNSILIDEGINENVLPLRREDDHMTRKHSILTLKSFWLRSIMDNVIKSKEDDNEDTT